MQVQFIEAGATVYRVTRGPSIFTNRTGREDCYISKRCATHGAKAADGNKYEGVARYAAESGEVLRWREPLPAELSSEKLKQRGFLDA